MVTVPRVVTGLTAREKIPTTLPTTEYGAPYSQYWGNRGYFFGLSGAIDGAPRGAIARGAHCHY